MLYQYNLFTSINTKITVNDYIPSKSNNKDINYNKLVFSNIIDNLKKEVYWGFSDTKVPKKEFKNSLASDFKLFTQIKLDIISDLKDIKYKLQLEKSTFDWVFRGKRR